MDVISQKQSVNAQKEKIFSVLTDCKNFSKFLPADVKDVEVTEESCKFTIPGITALTLSLIEKNEFSKVVYQATNDKDIPVNLLFHISDENNVNNIAVEINVDVPAFLASMVKKPLQNVVDMIAARLPQAIENN